MRFKGSLLLNFALLLGSLLFVFAVLESGTRLFHHFKTRQEGQLSELHESNQIQNLGKTNRLADLIRKSPSPQVVYELKPGIQAEFMGQQVMVNSWGGRSPEPAQSKAAKTKRIIGIGDSVMFGWGVAEEDTYLSQLERRLNSHPACGSFEILNFGVPGYNTAMELSLLQSKLLPLRPDYVIIHIVGNDMQLPRFMELRQSPWDLRKCFICSLLSERAALLLGRSPAADSNLLDVAADFSRRKDRYEIQGPYSWMVGIPSFRKSLFTLKRLAAENNFTLIMLVSSASGQMLKIARNVARDGSARIVEIKPFVDSYFAAHHPGASSQERFKLITIGGGDPHPNATGHLIYTDALQAVLLPDCRNSK